RLLSHSIGSALREDLERVFDEMAVPGPYSPDAVSAGRRALRLGTLQLLSWSDGGRRAVDLFHDARNMTEQFGAITTLMEIGVGRDQLDAFYLQWRRDRFVIDKWFAMQARHAPPAIAVEVVEHLTRHADFDMANLNRFRALFGSFATNSAGFHHRS